MTKKRPKCIGKCEMMVTSWNEDVTTHTCKDCGWVVVSEGNDGEWGVYDEA